MIDALSSENKKQIKSEVLSSENLDVVFKKYIGLGFAERSVARVIANLPSKKLLVDRKYFFLSYKILIVLTLLLQDFMFLWLMKNNNGSEMVMNVLYISCFVFTAFPVFLIFKNITFGYIWATLWYAVGIAIDLQRNIETLGTTSYVVDAIRIYLVVGGIYIISNIYPYKTIFGTLKKIGQNYKFQTI